MISNTIKIKIANLLKHLHSNTIEYNLSVYQHILNEINKIKSEFKNKTDAELRIISETLKDRSRSNEPLNNLIIESFALIRETISRVLKVEPFDVQIIGGLAIHSGRLAEMQTGEGKTMTAVFPVYLNALSGKGVHILTFNDYLARRDANWMGPVYNFLGLSVGFVQEKMSKSDRQRAYCCDVTFLTAKESGFDYLRDNLCLTKSDMVHRELNYAIFDEADSILIDEAKVPLIIAEASTDQIADAHHMAEIARNLDENKDFELDEYGRNIHFTEKGIKRIEKILSCNNLYDEKNIELLTRLNCAIHAEHLLHRDIDYIVRNRKIELVDEFTGRVAEKRRWPDGLQAAIEAKENIDIQSKGKILNSITLQHFIRLYNKISGMTATAKSSEKEFQEFYNLQITVIPPNKPCIRKDYDDLIFLTKVEKFKAIINEIMDIHKTNRPILVGTRSIEESANLAAALQNMEIRCEVLNAKRDEHEARIIAEAGKSGAITISTNMAGRGTDIKLGGTDESEKKQIAALGGLYVIGTNRYENPRIDNQLRGRAGRQGDPGSSRFFISLEDELFIKYRLNELLPKNMSINVLDHKIDDPIVRIEIDRIQRIIEGQNLEIKKTIYKYSSLLEKQRIIISKKRNDLIFSYNILDILQTNSPEQYRRLSDYMDKEKFVLVCKRLALFWLDNLWSQYLFEINDIREGIHFRRLGGQDPVYEFHKLSVEIFSNLLNIFDDEIIQSFNKIEFKNNDIDLNKAGIKTPSSTWTYLINDNSFEEMLGVQLMGNLGHSIGAAIHGPIMALFVFWKKLKNRD